MASADASRCPLVDPVTGARCRNSPKRQRELPLGAIRWDLREGDDHLPVTGLVTAGERAAHGERADEPAATATATTGDVTPPATGSTTKPAAAAAGEINDAGSMGSIAAVTERAVTADARARSASGAGAGLRAAPASALAMRRVRAGPATAIASHASAVSDATTTAADDDPVFETAGLAACTSPKPHIRRATTATTVTDSCPAAVEAPSRLVVARRRASDDNLQCLAGRDVEAPSGLAPRTALGEAVTLVALRAEHVKRHGPSSRRSPRMDARHGEGGLSTRTSRMRKDSTHSNHSQQPQGCDQETNHSSARSIARPLLRNHHNPRS